MAETNKDKLKLNLPAIIYINAVLILLVIVVLWFLVGYFLLRCGQPPAMVMFCVGFLSFSSAIFVFFGGILGATLASVGGLPLAALLCNFDLVFGRAVRQLIGNDFALSRMSLSIVANKAIFDGQLLDAEKLLIQLADSKSDDDNDEAIHVSVSTIESGLMAHVYAWTGRSAEALKVIDRTIALAESAYSHQPDDIGNQLVAEVYGNVGSMLGVVGQSERALDLLRKSVEIREKLFGLESEEVARSLNNLSSVQRQMGQIDEAEKSIVRAREILEKKNKSSYILGYVLDSQAQVLIDKGRYEEALVLSNRALKLGQLDVHERALRHYTKGLCLEHLKRKKEALKFYSKALELWSKMQGFKHPSVDNCRKKMTELARRAG